MNGGFTSGEYVINPGPKVRPEYLRLPRDLVDLARGFNLDLPEEYQRDAAILVFSIECTDRVLDAIPTPLGRAQFSRKVIECLQGHASGHNDFTPELLAWLLRLERLIRRRQIGSKFCEIVYVLLANSEQMRNTQSSSMFVKGAVKEGRLMVELLLLILGHAGTPQFNEFMRRVGEPANLGDKLRDAHRDFAFGELAIKPGLIFHFRLIYEMLRRVGCLAFRFGGHWRILAWGFKSLFVEVILIKP
ncbi:MAG: hypothetical protein JWQ71_463 [Pedosphaera sp.]|nr:hypothetical protein [Pedosphaera sp.]